MQYSYSIVMAFAAAASAATIKVAVGQSGLTYTPNDITAAVGDSVEFSFFPKNHTVTQSSFADPCHPLAGGFFSGFVPTNASTLGSTFTITVKDPKPVWIYCAQTVLSHCQSGMVAAINAPKTGNNTLDAFTNLAKKASNSTFPGGAFTPVGGDLILSKGNGSSAGNGTSGGSGSGSSSSYTSTYTTSYSTSETKTTSYSSTYTSNGVVYTTAYPSTYTTAYTTAVATTATGVSGGSGSGSSSTSKPQVTSGAAAGSNANMIGMAAVVLGALAMV